MKWSGGESLRERAERAVLIVDGYNVINAWPELSGIKDQNLEGARQALIDIMVNYAGYSGQEITVVFDGRGPEDTVTIENGVKVCFTRDGETADQFIERLVGDEVKNAREVFVATSDYTEQRIILGRGAHRLSSRELYREVEKMRLYFERLQENNKIRDGMLTLRLKEEVRAALEALRRR